MYFTSSIALEKFNPVSCEIYYLQAVGVESYQFFFLKQPFWLSEGRTWSYIADSKSWLLKKKNFFNPKKRIV